MSNNGKSMPNNNCSASAIYTKMQYQYFDCRFVQVAKHAHTYYINTYICISIYVHCIYVGIDICRYRYMYMYICRYRPISKFKAKHGSTFVHNESELKKSCHTAIF